MGGGTDPAAHPGPTHQETRDAAGTLVAQTDFAYDTAGNRVSVTDGVGRQTRTTFDAAGHKTSETQGYGTAQAATTTFAYDDAGNLIEVTDPVGNHTFFSYQDGLKVSMTDPQGHTATYAYDDAGQMTSMTDRDGRRTDFAYDGDGNKVSEKWYDPSGTLVETLSWTYDADGNVLTASSSAGTYRFRYDGAGRVVHVDEPLGVSMDFTYDTAGNRILVVDSLGGSVASTYDGNQLVRRVFSQSGQPTLRIDFTYDLAGNVSRQVRTSNAAGTTVVASSAFSYDGGQLTALADTNGNGTTLAAYTFAYDTAGQLTAKTDHGVSTTYHYDALGQLTGDGSASFSFDTNGNRTMAGYVTGAGNQLLSDGTWNYAYDAEGNLTSKTNSSTGAVWTFAYDTRNQMIRAEHKPSATGAVDVRVLFTYDVFGNLLEKDAYTYGPGSASVVTTKYALDGWKTGPQAEAATGNANWDIWADLNGDGSLQTRYLRGDAIDEVFARVGADGSAYWTMTDNQGSVRDVVDQTGAVKDNIRFDSFGNITAETDPAYRGSYGWTGRVWVAEVGLQYNRARFYDPTDGRWIGQDPDGFAAGDADLYRYDRNSPTNATDPSGQELLAKGSTTAGDYARWLRGEADGKTAALYGKGLGIKGISVREASSGRYVFAYTEAARAEIEQKRHDPSVPAWDRDALEALVSKTKTLEVSWQTEVRPGFTVSNELFKRPTDLSESEKAAIDQEHFTQIYKDDMSFRNYTEEEKRNLIESITSLQKKAQGKLSDQDARDLLWHLAVARAVFQRRDTALADLNTVVSNTYGGTQYQNLILYEGRFTTRQEAASQLRQRIEELGAQFRWSLSESRHLAETEGKSGNDLKAQLAQLRTSQPSGKSGGLNFLLRDPSARPAFEVGGLGRLAPLGEPSGYAMKDAAGMAAQAADYWLTIQTLSRTLRAIKATKELPQLGVFYAVSGGTLVPLVKDVFASFPRAEEPGFLADLVDHLLVQPISFVVDGGKTLWALGHNQLGGTPYAPNYLGRLAQGVPINQEKFEAYFWEQEKAWAIEGGLYLLTEGASRYLGPARAEGAAVSRTVLAEERLIKDAARTASNAPQSGAMRFRSTYQGGPYEAGRFGRGGTLWDAGDAAYRSGQVRAERIVHEAGRQLGVDVRTLVDEIIYVPGADAPFFVVQNGRRILALNKNAALGSDQSLRLLKAAHEVGHARVYNNPALRGALSYEAEEVLVESQARAALGPNVTRATMRKSVIYENWYRQLQGLPQLPVP